MAQTKIRQSSQIFQSTVYDDSLAAGATLESGAVSLQDDLNALRSQFTRIQGGTNWYDALAGRNVETLSTDLTDLEDKPLLYRTQILADISVPATQNYVVLSVAGLETPSEAAAVGAATTEGAVVAFNATFGTATLDLVAGPTALNPRNLLIIRDAISGDSILSGGKLVYGLLQSESNVNGHAFNDTTSQVQISFVRENVAGTALELVPVADIENFTINYAYVLRVFLDNLPQDAFLQGVFVDVAASMNPTLQTVIDAQGNTAVLSSYNTEINLQSSTYSWQFTTGASGYTLFGLDRGFDNRLGSNEIFRVQAPNLNNEFVVDDGVGLGTRYFRVNAGSGLGAFAAFDVTDWTVTNVNAATFTGEVQAGTAGNHVSLGAGGVARVQSEAASDLIVKGSLELLLDDDNKTGSGWGGSADGIKLSDSQQEWVDYIDTFGSVSLLRGIYEAQQEVNRLKLTAVVTSATIAANTDLVSGVNIDTDLVPFTSGAQLVNQMDVYLNGQLMRAGLDATANFDVYPGTTPANGDLRFEFALTLGDVITVVRNGPQ